MTSISTGNGSTNTVVSPPAGNISIQGYAPHFEQTTLDHPQTQLALHLS